MLEPIRPDPLAQAVGRRIAEQRLLGLGETIVVALSGGPDSVALLSILRTLAPPQHWRLVVAHFDHQLRPDSIDDARYCRRLARRWGLRFVGGSGDVSGFARAGGYSLEDAARRRRYAFLRQTAQEADATVVATGHQADDQAETILLHLTRGSGTNGLRGMARRGPLPDGGSDGVELVRPLLDLRHDELTAYCRRLRLRPRQDPSNASREFTRNRIRHEILPRLADLNPRVVEALGRLAEAARADADFLEAGVDRAWPQVVTARGDRTEFDSQALRDLPVALRSRLLRRAANTIGLSLTAVQLAALERCLVSPEAGSVSLAPGVAFWHAGPRCGLGAVPWAATAAGATWLIAPGEVRWAGWRIAARTGSSGAPTHLAGIWVAQLAVDRLPAILEVRSRRPGDRLHPLGLSGSKSLHDYFIDAKVPRDVRDRIPVVASGSHVIWVVGRRLDRCFLPRTAGEELIELVAQHEESP